MSENGNGNGRQFDQDIDDLTNEEILALSRAAEARANVLRGLSVRMPNPERYDSMLSEATDDAQRFADTLRERGIDPVSGDPTQTVLDKEGTAPTLADGEGNFAENAEVANLGGIGIKDSNTNPERVRQELQDRVDPEKQVERRRNLEEAQAIIRSGGVRPEDTEEGEGSTNPARRARRQREREAQQGDVDASV